MNDEWKWQMDCYLTLPRIQGLPCLSFQALFDPFIIHIILILIVIFYSSIAV